MTRILAILGVIDVLGAVLWVTGALSVRSVPLPPLSEVLERFQGKPDVCDSRSGAPPGERDLEVSGGYPVNTGTGWAWVSGAVINHAKDWTVTDLSVTVARGSTAATERSVLQPGEATWWEAIVGRNDLNYRPAATYTWVRADCPNLLANR
jgi:hypothetical protein